MDKEIKKPILPCAVATDKVAITFHIKSNNNQDNDECVNEDDICVSDIFGKMTPLGSEIYADILAEKAKYMYNGLELTEKMYNDLIEYIAKKDD